MNYVDLSGIYPIQNIAYVFWVMLVNPPSIWILDSNWRSSMNFIAFREVEVKVSGASSLIAILVFYHAAKCKLSLFAESQPPTLSLTTSKCGL